VPAANAIDWALPAPRIGDRATPLKEKTRERIRVGLKKYANFMVDMIHTPRDDGASMVFPLTNPHRTQLGQITHGLVVQLSYGEGDRSRPVSQPMPTQTTRQDTALVVPPFLAKLYGTSVVEALDGPLGTQTANIHHALVVPYYSTGVASSTAEPVPTVTTVDRHALVVPPFVLGYYTRLSGVQAAVSGIDEPLPTQSTQPRHYLVQPGEAPTVDDCGFRMLQPHEIHNAMAFPADYVVLGNKRDRVRQLGNAVTPPVMQMLVERVARSLA
jgi:DNA (cytosine-5)-methyltransferase 1